MAFPGAYLTIIYTALLHFTFLGANSLLLNLLNISSKTVVFSVQGLVFISYPLIGLLADVKLTRYRMICLSCWVTFVSHTMGSVGSTLGVFGVLQSHIATKFVVTFSLIMIVTAIVGKGMFESTVIQFGTDQMIGASSAQLRTFIYWYYWSLHVGEFCSNIILSIILIYFSQCHLSDLDSVRDIKAISWLLISVAALQSILCCISLLLLYLKKFKNYLNIEPVGTNPIKQIVDIIKYAYHHKYPVRRSALSYYLNTYPSRIDFGKVQYGGPFTNEEVEDTKTALRLLVLLLSLFGFCLSSDGFSNTSHVLMKSCPSSLMLLLLVGNPSLISDVIILVGIPVFHLFIKSSLGKYFPNIMKRMWFGLLLLCLQEFCSLVINFQVNTSFCISANDMQNNFVYFSSLKNCYTSVIQFSNITEWNTTDCIVLNKCSSYTMDSTLMWLLVPHILHGFGYMLVFVSVLEFICAQAPFRLKGFMVGIWYAMFSIKYIITVIESIYTHHEKAWIIYESIKIGIIGLSLIIFGISCRWYRYRERNEVVNVQGMIEDIFEKELNQQQNDEDISDGEDTVLLSSVTNYNTFD